MEEVNITKDQHSTALSLLRHAVPITLLLGLYALVAPRADDALTQWVGGIGFVFGTSFVLVGLFSLYAKSRSRAVLAIRTRNIAWALTILLFVDPLLSQLSPTTTAPTATPALYRPTAVRLPEPLAPRVSSVETSINPEGTTLLRQMRAKYPELKGLSDQQAVRAIHEAFYSDLPLAQVALKLGVQLSE